MKFKVDDEVRVINPKSPFLGWQGRVSDLSVPSLKRYRVSRFLDVSGIEMSLVFTETELEKVSTDTDELLDAANER